MALLKKKRIQKFAVGSAELAVGEGGGGRGGLPVFWSFSKTEYTKDIHQFNVFYYIIFSPLSIDYSRIIMYPSYFFSLCRDIARKPYFSDGKKCIYWL